MPVARVFHGSRWTLAALLAVALVPVATQARAAEAPTAAPVATQVLAVADTQTLTGSIAGGDASQTGRIVRDGHEHGCETPTAMPGLQNATPVAADVFILQNNHSETRCIVVEGDFSGCAGKSTQVNAYSSYDAANPATNVIGGTGFSTIGKATYGFQVAANAAFTLVVHETVAAAGCPAYSIKVTNVPLAATITEGHGADPVSITPTVTGFRAALGGAGAQREITWEEVPEASADPANLPLDYFNTTSPLGLVFTAPTQVRVSSDGSGATPAEFGSLNAANAARYQPFSGVRLFTPYNGTQADLTFRIPGSATPAPTSAFGAVLVSPGAGGFLVPRDADGNPLGIYVPPAQDNGLGFYGLRYPTAQIYSMSLVGSVNTGATAGTVFDNFIYAVPGGPPVAPAPDCSAQQAKVTQLHGVVDKDEAKVKKAKKRVSDAGTAAELTKAKAKLKKAKKKLKKAKQELTSASAALNDCLT
jgi:hypothetical protein